MYVVRVIGVCTVFSSVLAIMAFAVSPTITPILTLKDAQARDQDDMCIWLHPEDPAQSTIITSDKTAKKLFVYNLEGATIQVISIDGKPGNIDLRHGFRLNGKNVAIVGFNERAHSSILLYAVDKDSRMLSRVDNGAIETGPNYGFTLYRSPRTGKFYAFTVPEKDGTGAEQYELKADGTGKIAGTKVRAWKLGHSEGCVADDSTGQIYIAEEDRGIWKVGAEPRDPTPGELIISLGRHDFAADAEGLTICYGRNGSGYLIASSQGNSQFKIFRREAPHEYVATFKVAGARATDGIDALNVNLGPTFPNGIFTLHNGKSAPYPVLICDLGTVKAVAEGDASKLAKE
ncbi:MAG: phytase [Candidatus Hydrogenedentota bacterium]